MTEKETQEYNAVTGNLVSFVGITESHQINKDAKFLDEIKKVFDEYETSSQFTTNICSVYHSSKPAREHVQICMKFIVVLLIEAT